MSIHSILPTRDASADTSSIVRQAGANQQLDQQAFLKLLSTQLSNQNPLSPQDDQQFLAQLAQFSSVEGINNLKTSQTHLQASQLLGKTIHSSVVLNNKPQDLTGQVAAVRWDSQGVHLTLNDANRSEVLLDQVTQVSE